MAQDEQPIPTSGNSKRKSSALLPRYFRTIANEKFLSATLDQLINPGVVEKVDGYFGRRDSKARKTTDNYINDVSPNRENYQFEPALVATDSLDNVYFYRDYRDYVNAVKIRQGNTENHSLLNQQEYYSWSPHIDWDKFANFRDYYWLANGTDYIPVYGMSNEIESTIPVLAVDNLDNNAYTFTEENQLSNSVLTLYRGQTYTFEIDTPGMPFSIRYTRDTEETSYYNSGVSEQDIEQGTITFKVPVDAPDSLFYVNSNDVEASNVIKILSPEENSQINVEEEIIGRRSYKMTNGYNLTNGMKLKFYGEVTPEKYADGEWYVEGVGSNIKLIKESDLEIPSAFLFDRQVEFDDNPFDKLPFDDATAYAQDKDYICINRSSKDRNQWSRYNRWFHKTAIEITAKINGQQPDLDQTNRAKRPIIEFEPGLKLTNFGTFAKQNVDLIDTVTKDVFSDIEGSTGYYVDGVELVNGMRVLFSADTDLLVNGKIYTVKFISINNQSQISLVETDDTDPKENETILVNAGNKNRGKMFYYTNGAWKATQDKTSVNQQPLFDVFDQEGVSYTDYESSDFQGTKLFSYKQGNGVVDTELGFSLTYKSIENSGDIVFEFDIASDTFNYQDDVKIITKDINTGSLRQYTTIENYKSVNGWTKGYQYSNQPVIRIYDTSLESNNFKIDVYDNSASLNDIGVKVFVNNELKNVNVDYTVQKINNYSVIVFTNDLTDSDILIVKTISSSVKNENGYYEFPINLERNPNNEELSTFTLGQVIDHVQSIANNHPNFEGQFPGASNLRDLGPLSKYGTKFVKHSGPVNLASIHLTSKDYDAVKALRFAKKEYSKFKKLFLQTADELGFDGPVKVHVDKILNTMMKSKTESDPFYFSDMVAFGGDIRTEYTVLDTDVTFFALTDDTFNLNQLSEKAVGVYINGLQLCYGIDYVITDEGFVSITTPLQENDLVEIFEYNSTDGCWIPPTPTKLGLFPKYQPQIILDTTYQNPVEMIQGHDGSLIKSYGDFRDGLILELEKRIFNNIKIEYNEEIFNYKDIKVDTRKLNDTLIVDFAEWFENSGVDSYTDNYGFERGNGFTYNYSLGSDTDNNPLLGGWRAIYIEWLDTDRPHTHPWEMLGFTIKPTWWEEQYGPAPYTRNNNILWEDIEKGIIAEPGKKKVYISRYARKDITKYIPADDQGNLVSPAFSGYAKNLIDTSYPNDFVFGDQGPVETAWRRNSEYRFSILAGWMLNQPARFFGLAFDRSRIEKNDAGQLVYSPTQKPISIKDLIFPNLVDGDERVLTAGIVNYMQGYLTANTNVFYESYKKLFTELDNRLAIKVGGFTEKTKFKLILDSRNPTNEGNIFVPDENYRVHLTTSVPIDVVAYSGVAIEKQASGFVVSGYDRNNPKFTINSSVRLDNDPLVKVGGVSEPFVKWDAGKRYEPLQIIEEGTKYYRVNQSFTSGDRFSDEYLTALPYLPTTGGREALFARTFETPTTTVPYGTTFRTVQEVVDFLLGYGKYLETLGFKFNGFNKEIETVENWQLSAKEFMFWSLQNWQAGAVITLSPGARQLEYSKEYTVVDDIYDNFYDYSLLDAGGQKITEEFANTIRDNSSDFGIATKNTAAGIYHLKVPSVQKEHVILLDNKTIFNDIIYDKPSGYRQERIKVLGYRTDEWNGGLNIPGFIYDDATATDWESFKDYPIGSIVKYKQYYYTAKQRIYGTESFQTKDWVKLSQKPESQLIANFDYKANQFGDFYDLDSDNFDTEQQRLAQHLIGYQKRRYLENIIPDSVSQYKFYQGFIQDKGTRNALTKLFDKIGSADKDSLEFYEEWAFRVGQYGAVNTFEEIEFPINESKVRLSPQPFELVDSVDPQDTTLIYNYIANDVTVKPKDYDHKPFPTKYFTEGFIKNAGYVNENDIQQRLSTYDDILNLSIEDINLGNYTWISSDRDLDWNIYKYISLQLKVTSIVKAGDSYTITTNTNPTFSVGDIIGVLNTPSDSFFKVTKIELNKITATTTKEIEESEITNGIITSFQPVRVKSINEANSVLQNTELQINEKIWTDDDGTGKWTVLQQSNKFNPMSNIYDKVGTPEDSTDKGFGADIAVSSNNFYLAVSSPKDLSGTANIYFRPNELNDYNLLQNIIEPQRYWENNAGGFAESISLSADARWLAIGAPNATNLKSTYKGEYDATQTYNDGDIVTYTNQLWKSLKTQLPREVTTYSVPKTSAQGLQTAYTTSYPDIEYIIRGNYSFPTDATDHILIKAPADMYDSSSVNDVLSLQWNEFTSRNPSGYTPFNNDSVLNKNFFSTNKTIVDKIDEILLIDNTQAVPDVGDIVTTDTGRGEVQYRFNNADNKTIIYIKNLNGFLADEDDLYLGTLFAGTYTRLFTETYDYYQGWWYIDIGTTVSTTQVAETNEGLVIKNLTLEGDTVNDLIYANIFDNKQNEDPADITKVSYIETLSFLEGQTEIERKSSKWIVREPSQLDTELTVGSEFKIWLNTLPLGNIVQNPNAIGLEWSYLNSNNHTIEDKWSGWITVLFTNFDLQDNPFIPDVGDIVIDDTTDASAEVAFIQRFFDRIRIFVKNVSGDFSKGQQNQNLSTLSFYETDSTVRQIGNIITSEVEAGEAGQLLVIDSGTEFDIYTTPYLQNLEYWIYRTENKEGLTRVATAPSLANLNWEQTNVLDASETGSASGLTAQGAVAVYQRSGGNRYELTNVIFPADAADLRQFGSDVEIRYDSNEDFYRLFIRSSGNGTEENQGRIYVYRNEGNGWVRGQDPRFKGQWADTIDYFVGDIVVFGNQLFEAQTTLLPQAWNPMFWKQLEDGVDVRGHLPNDTDLVLESGLEQTGLIEFGNSFDIDEAGKVLATTATYKNLLDSDNPVVKVVVYRRRELESGDNWQLVHTIEQDFDNEDFAKDIAISNDGKSLAIGCPSNDQVVRNGGVVRIYDISGTTVDKTQEIRGNDYSANTRFGAKVDFDGVTLAVTSKGGDISRPTTFDNETTLFDNGITEFISTDSDSGLVTLYEKYNTQYLLANVFSYQDDTAFFGDKVIVKNNHVYVGLPKQSVTAPDATSNKGIVAEYRKQLNTTLWTAHRTPIDTADLDKFKGVYLYNNKTNQLKEYIDYIDPIQGKIAGTAEQNISFKTSYDPATYSNVADGYTNVKDELLFTNEEHVGKLWWNIGKAKFYNNYQGTIIESSNNFNKLFEGAEIEVCEWVGSTYSPDEWDKIANTEQGLSKGVSGKSLYGNNVYSAKRIYDKNTGTFSNKYFYWVKNPTLTPNVAFRTASCKDVADLISNPANQGYKFVNILSNNRFVLYNCESLIENDDTSIVFSYYTIDDQSQNKHFEYQILTEDLDTSVPTAELERKWFESLVGLDAQDRPVPDINLGIKQRYGTLDNPKQSWFVNRIEASKQFIERSNLYLKQNLIVDEFDISPLFQKEEAPTEITGQWDTNVDIYEELRFISTAQFKQAQVTPIIVNGRITELKITDPGFGYVNKPTYQILNTDGEGAEFEFNINELGQVVSATVKNVGKNYTENTIVRIRRYSVIVNSDVNVGNKWAVYEWTGTEWTRTETQAFDTTLFWNYADWYASGYSQFTAVNHIVDASYQLSALDDDEGQVVKIKNVGTGGWLLLKKIDDQDTEDYTVNYETIGRQNGTIQLSTSLYDVAGTNLGYDGTSFDKTFYDNQPTQEYRIILDTLKNKIFVDNLRIYYNKLFFASIRYVLSEQPTVDWLFKTSFVKAKHNFGDLEQKITFQNDNLSSYEDYVNEAKPYKTKIREYLSSYTKVDPSATTVTDFDLAPFYNESQGKIVPQQVIANENAISQGETLLDTYPSRHWLDNVGYQVTEILIGESGSGYVNAPDVRIVGGGGTGATAIAYVGRGKVNRIVVTNPGTGYIGLPEVILEGPIADGGTPARASAKLGNGKVRSSHIRVKFDRTTGTYLITTLEETETFITTVNQQIFDLKWPMSVKSSDVTITVNNLESLKSEFTIENVKDTSKGYDRFVGRIKFDVAPNNQSEIVIKYKKDVSLLQAQDRVNLFYEPTSGMLGKDVAQLFDGIDYGGVEVTSFDFGSGSGWDSDKWFTSTYDTFDGTYEDEVFQLDGSTAIFELSTPLENGVIYNIYKNGVRLDDPNYGTEEQTNLDAVMQSITGDGSQTTIIIDEELIPTVDGDIIVIRKETSDGSFLPDARSYDTLLSGGDLKFTTAKGVNAEEIVVDGDGFVTPTTSKGPEELIPGQVLDTVDIKVYHRPGEGGSQVSSNNYIADGSTKRFKFGLLPQSADALLVKLDKVIQPKSAYTVNYKQQYIEFSVAPNASSSVNIISLTGNGQKIIDMDQYIGDGSTSVFVTDVNWQENLSFYATVDGKAEEVLIETSDSTYSETEKVLLVFGKAPKANSVINFAIYASESRSWSQIEIDQFTGDGSTSVYELSQSPFSAKPASNNVIVKIDNKILNAGYNQSFIITNALEYQLRNWQQTVGSFGSSDIAVFLNGRELNGITEYNVRPANSSVVLFRGVANIGDTLDVYVRTDGEYQFGYTDTDPEDSSLKWYETPQQLHLDVAPADGANIEVYHFSNHDVQDFERINFDVVARRTLDKGTIEDIEFQQLKNGLIKLRKPALDAQYVWVTLNGLLLTPSVDYYLTDDKNYIKIDISIADDDVIELIQFSSSGEISPKFGYRIFKDMLNRVHYKRLGDNNKYKLAKTLSIFDKEIVLENAQELGQPDKANNVPGIIFINGERIEFLVKEENVLKQITRGTLGTGVKQEHDIGSDVYDQGYQQTVPYLDQTEVVAFDGDGSTREFALEFGVTNADEVEVFVGGKRLKKTSYQMFNPTLDQDSPEADETIEAEFSIIDSTDTLVLNVTPEVGERVQVVRRVGRTWTTDGNSLEDTQNLIARFLKAEKVDLPK